jgi:hypothetical protein
MDQYPILYIIDLIDPPLNLILSLFHLPQWVTLINNSIKRRSSYKLSFFSFKKLTIWFLCLYRFFCQLETEKKNLYGKIFCSLTHSNAQIHENVRKLFDFSPSSHLRILFMRKMFSTRFKRSLNSKFFLSCGVGVENHPTHPRSIFLLFPFFSLDVSFIINILLSFIGVVAFLIISCVL